MALSNRDRVGKMFEAIAPALDDYISSVIGAVDPSAGANWVQLVAAKDKPVSYTHLTLPTM